MPLALPSRRDEAWRWSDLSDLPALADARPTAQASDVSHLWLGLGGPKLLFVDGNFDAERSDLQQVVVGSLDLVTDHPLAAYATGKPGWHLNIDADRAALGVEIIHVATGGANHLQGSLVLSEDAVASVVETYVGSGWSNRLSQVSMARSSRLMRAVRIAQDSGFVSLRDEAEIGANASYVATVLGAGGCSSRIDADLSIWGEAAFAEMGGALLSRGGQRHEAAVVVRHEAVSGTSRQVWRAVADDTAHASLAARVEVARGAQKTDGEQSLRGLLLKRGATINLKPELEIFADDVKCAHGATVGELDAAALFYLESRGIAPPEAKALLTRAFVADALERIGEGHGSSLVRPGDEPAPMSVREAFVADADAWLSSPPASGRG